MNFHADVFNEFSFSARVETPTTTPRGRLSKETMHTKTRRQLVFADACNTPRAKSGRKYLVWTKNDTTKIRDHFESFIFKGKNAKLQKEALTSFIVRNELETLRGRSFEQKLYRLRIKINNDKRIMEGKAARALEKISKI